MPAAVTCAGTTDFDRTCAGCDRFRPDEPHRSVPIDAQAIVCRRSMRELKSARAALSTNPINVPDPIRKRFGYGQSRPVMAVTASVQPESARIVYMPDPMSRLRFSSVFPKKAWLIVCETDGLVRVWPNAIVLEASWCAGIIWPGFWPDANGPLPASHFPDSVPFSHRRPG